MYLYMGCGGNKCHLFKCGCRTLIQFSIDLFNMGIFGKFLKWFN